MGSPFADFEKVLVEIETHVLSRLRLARSPYIQVLQVSRNVQERRIDIDALVEGTEVQMICEAWDDPNGYYFDTWIEIPLAEFPQGQGEEIYRHILVHNADFESRIFLDEMPAGVGSRLMIGRATRCLDGLEEMLSEILNDGRNLAKALSEQFDIHPLSGTGTPQVH